MICVALETALKICDFQNDFGVTQNLATVPVDGKLAASGATATAVPGSLKPILEILRRRLGILRLRREYVHSIHGTLETGLHISSGGNGGKQFRRRFVVSCSFTYMLWYILVGVLIIPKWLIHDS